MKLAPTPLAFKGRIIFLQALVVLAFAAVLAGYYRVQILQRERYEELGEKYRTKKRRIKAARGLIYDRNHHLIAQNMPTYNSVLLRDEMEQSWRRLKPEIAQFLNVSTQVLDERYKTRSHLLSQPVILQEGISFEAAMRIKRNELRYPGLSIETSEKRHYPYDTMFTHVLGYVAEASETTLRHNPNLRLGDFVGKRGVELAYNDILTGVDGEKTIHVNHQGVYLSQNVSTPPIPGKDLNLTLDFELQRIAMEALEGKGGAVVMMDVNTGGILVYVSSPAFNLNLFSSGFTKEAWDELLNSPGRPFMNRPIQGAYAPGSIFKLVTAMAALEMNKITPATRYFCGGAFVFSNHTYGCWNKGGHGWVDLEGAIKGSCNVYFYNVARDLDVDDLAATAGSLGIGHLTGIDLVGEKPGLMPTSAWKKKVFKQIWYPGETLSVAIGQGSVQTTPMQMVQLMAAIATEGYIPTPHLIQNVEGQQEQSHETRFVSNIKREHFRVLKSAMWDVVNSSNGTGSKAMVPGMDVCGKTGTAQLRNFSTEAEHKIDAYKNAWFASFAPRENAEVALVVLVEHASAGGAKAAPIAKLLYQAYQRRKQAPPPKSPVDPI